MFCAQFPKGLEKTWLGQDAVHIAGYGFDDHAGEFRAHFLEGDPEGVSVVKR